MNNQQLEVKFTDETIQGKYANAMTVSHTQEEFILDFVNAFPPIATLNSRLIISPGHLKRIVQALVENISQYEAKFGSIQRVELPVEPKKIGFKTDNTANS